jgi:hypothetical protein
LLTAVERSAVYEAVVETPAKLTVTTTTSSIWPIIACHFICLPHDIQGIWGLDGRDLAERGWRIARAPQ